MSDTVSSEVSELRARLEQLEQENRLLREHRSARDPGAWLRSTAVVVLMALAFALTPATVVAVWSRNTLLDTDRYVETVTPLAAQSPVVEDVARVVTDAIFAQVDVERLLTDNLPPELAFASGPIAAQVRSTTEDLVVKALGTEEFQQIWESVNRQASETLVALLSSDSTTGTLQIQDGKLVLDLAPVVAQVKQQLSKQGLDFVEQLPSVGGTVTLPVANVQYIQDAQEGARLLNNLALVLPFLVLFCFGGAIALARDRRRSVVWSGLLIALSMLLLGLAMALGRGAYLDSIPTELASRETAALVFDTLVRFLRNGIRVMILVGLLIAAIAAITGPSSGATAVRTRLGGLLTEGGSRTGIDTGAFGRFVATYRRQLQVGALATFGVVFLLSGTPTPGTILWLVVGLLVAVAAIQFFAATAPQEQLLDAPADENIVVDAAAEPEEITRRDTQMLTIERGERPGR